MKSNISVFYADSPLPPINVPNSCVYFRVLGVEVLGKHPRFPQVFRLILVHYKRITDASPRYDTEGKA